MTGPLQSMKTGMSNAFSFSGRATRSEFWWFVVLYNVALHFIARIVGPVFLSVSGGSFVSQLVVGLALQIPVFAAIVRRAHDVSSIGVVEVIYFAIAPILIVFFLVIISPTGGNPPDWIRYAIFVIPVVFVLGGLWTLWTLLTPSTPGPNKYGPNPYEVQS